MPRSEEPLEARRCPPEAEGVLGRVTDPAALDDERGAIGALELTVPPAWAGGRARIRVPRAVTCRRCEGGGCDACGRRGALPTPEGEGARAIDVQLPPDLGRTVAVRVPRPFGDAAPIAQLVLTFVPGPEGERIELLAPHAGDPPRPGGSRVVPVAVVLGVAALLVVVRLLLG